jgi:hypothetical protein
MASINQTIIQAKVTLQDIEPAIWRRLLLPPTLNLAELHHVLQAAFGWRDEHLHEFIIGGLAYGAPELADEAAAEDDPQTFEATDVHLRDFDLYHVPDLRFLYHYDFGDSWLHLVAFEQRIAKDTGLKYPACVDGARHRPPETSAEPPATSSASKPGATPLTKSTRPCANGPDAPSIPRNSISRPPTKPSRPPVAEPAATMSSVANEPPRLATAIVADRPRKLSLHRGGRGDLHPARGRHVDTAFPCSKAGGIFDIALCPRDHPLRPAGRCSKTKFTQPRSCHPIS